MSRRIYLDNAATTPLASEVVAAMTDVIQHKFGNPSSIHSFGREARVLVEQARNTIAGLLNASPSEIIFTSSGTEAINMSIWGCVNELGVNHFITSPIEHHAVLNSLNYYVKKGQASIDYVKLDNSGQVDIEHLEKLLRGSKRSLVSLMHANNEIGCLLPLKNISELCMEHDALFLCDTVQTIGKFKLDFQNTKVHFATCSAHKIHGPKGSGFLYLNGDITMGPMIQGGHQERNMRSGTENVAGIVGMAKAIEIAYEALEERQQYIASLKEYMVERLREEIPDVVFNAESDQKGLYTILNVAFNGSEKAEMLQYNLDINQVAVSSGSACSSGAEGVSHVLEAIHADPKRVSLRISFSRYNTKDELDKTAALLKKYL